MILQIIQDAAAQLTADPYFSNIAVFSEDLGDPSNSIDLWLSKKTGIGVQLVTPKANVTKPDKGSQGTVYYDGIIFWATVWENVKLNRGNSGTGKAALDVAETAACILHHYQPTFAIETITLNSQGITIIPHPQLLGYRIGFTTQGGANYNIPTVALPVVSAVASGGTSTVTITCGTTNAFVFYSTDGTSPSPLDKNGSPRTPYSAPFTVPTGTQIKTRGWLPGYVPSKLVAQNV